MVPSSRHLSNRDRFLQIKLISWKFANM